MTGTGAGFGNLHLFGFETGIDVEPVILLYFLVPELEIGVGFEILRLLLQLGFVIDADVDRFHRLWSEAELVELFHRCSQ